MVSWSHTALKSYETCPFRYKREKVDKAYPFIQGEAARWGEYVHKCLEERIKDGNALPSNVIQYEPIAQLLTGMKGEASFENQMALNRSLEKVDWFAKDVWVRFIVDAFWKAGSVIKALDWKTGKPSTDTEQLRLFGAGLMAVYPDVEEVKGKYIYLKNMSAVDITITRDQCDEIWNSYAERVGWIETSHQHNNWPKKKNGLCKNYCPVKECEHNG